MRLPDDDSLISVASLCGFSTHDACAALRDNVPPASGSLKTSADRFCLEDIKKGYMSDPWCVNLRKAQNGITGIVQTDGLWYVGSRLVVPRVGHIRETLYRLAHDVLGHFGVDKTYTALRASYYWPPMCSDLEESYVPSCAECQRNKSSSRKPSGPLPPLSVPDGRLKSVAMDFVGPLPLDEGFDCILTIADRLGSDIKLIGTSTTISAEDLTFLYFNKRYCDNGLPAEIISNPDKLFTSIFWKALHKLTGVKVKLSTAYRPQMDGSSERTNKITIQSLRYHAERNQKGWARALPCVSFDLLNTVNASAGFSGFQLKTGRCPRIIPALSPIAKPSFEDIEAAEVIRMINRDAAEAQDNLLQAKIDQAAQANRSQALDRDRRVGYNYLPSLPLHSLLSVGICLKLCCSCLFFQPLMLIPICRLRWKLLRPRRRLVAAGPTIPRSTENNVMLRRFCPWLSSVSNATHVCLIFYCYAILICIPLHLQRFAIHG